MRTNAFVQECPAHDSITIDTGGVIITERFRACLVDQDSILAGSEGGMPGSGIVFHYDEW